MPVTVMSAVAAPVITVNPWTRSFTAGTRISAGLALALQVLRRDHVRGGRVLLVSDLNDDQQDVPSLTRIALRLRQDRIPIRVVAINASPTDEGFFARLLGSATAITPAAAPGQQGAPAERASITGTGALLLALLVSIPLALYSVIHRESTVDRWLRRGLMLGGALPDYFVSLVLVPLHLLWRAWIALAHRSLRTTEVHNNASQTIRPDVKNWVPL